MFSFALVSMYNMPYTSFTRIAQTCCFAKFWPSCVETALFAYSSNNDFKRHQINLIRYKELYNILRLVGTIIFTLT